MDRAGIEFLVGRLANITLESTLLERIREAQKTDPKLEELRAKVSAGKANEFEISKSGMLRFSGRICVPMDAGIRREILDEAHTTPYSLHPGTLKMYHDLKSVYLWSGMK